MFNNGRQNNGNGVNVNTRLYTSYSDTCMIALGAWNDKLSLKFHPMKGLNADGIRQYAQDNTEIVSTSLTVDNTTALLSGAKDVIQPALEKKEPASVSITMGADANRKVITLATNGDNITLSVIIGVAENGVADPNNSITHTFNKKEYMIGYDPSSGTGNTVSVNADYENFINKLNDVYKIDAAIPHATNYSNAIKNSFSNKPVDNSGTSYSAPTNTYSGNNMADFLPFN